MAGLAITFSKLKSFLKALWEIVDDPTACTKKNDADLISKPTCPFTL